MNSHTLAQRLSLLCGLYKKFGFDLEREDTMADGRRKIAFTINRFEIIAKRGIIARLSYYTSFGLYEKVDFLKHF